MFIDTTLLVFLLICYICFGLITSAIFNLDMGIPLSTAEIIIYTNPIIHSLAVFGIIFSLTRQILLSFLVMIIALIIKLVPLKHKKNCSVKNEDLGTDKSCYRVRHSVNVKELVKARS